MASKITYNKLVRDKIPQIIEENGNRCTTRRLSRSDYRQCLEDKLAEEFAEYRQSGELEELADILEVIEALAEEKGSSWQELRGLQQAKRDARGGFRERIFLESVTKE